MSESKSVDIEEEKRDQLDKKVEQTRITGEARNKATLEIFAKILARHLQKDIENVKKGGTATDHIAVDVNKYRHEERWCIAKSFRFAVDTLLTSHEWCEYLGIYDCGLNYEYVSSSKELKELAEKKELGEQKKIKFEIFRKVMSVWHSTQEKANQPFEDIQIKSVGGDMCSAYDVTIEHPPDWCPSCKTWCACKY
jgi:hypothetical protein